ncbi:MAG TPA: hypothetical protein VF789_23160 [Thermoanaerobaculia bacterium]
MKTPLVASAFLLLLLAHATSASAMCAFARGPRLLEARILSCEDPRAMAEGKMRKFASMSGPEAQSVDGFLAANPGRVLTLRVTRFQQLNTDPRGGEKVVSQPWAKAEAKEERYVFLGPESCEQIAKEKVLLEQMDCCDTIPPAGLSCLLELPGVVLLPEK